MVKSDHSFWGALQPVALVLLIFITLLFVLTSINKTNVLFIVLVLAVLYFNYKHIRSITIDENGITLRPLCFPPLSSRIEFSEVSTVEVKVRSLIMIYRKDGQMWGKFMNFHCTNFDEVVSAIVDNLGKEKVIFT